MVFAVFLSTSLSFYPYYKPQTMYSPDSLEIIAEILMVTCITALSLVFGRKIASIEGPVRYIRGLLLLFYGLSWAFDLISCMSSSTNNGNYISCLVGFFNCVILHTVTKVVLYLYFTEKVKFMRPNSNSVITRPLTHTLYLGLYHLSS